MRLRWGICTAGLVANDFMVGLSTLARDEHAVVAIAETMAPDRAKELAVRHGVGAVYRTHEELATDPNVEIVYVAAVNQHHFPLCKLFLSHGKHVLCEKPLGLNKRESKEIIRLAKETKLFFMEGWWSRFFPASAKLRDLIWSGAIGQVKFLQVAFGFAMDFKERLLKKEFGGGVIMDIGTYVLNLALMVFDQRPLSCTGKGFLTGNGVDETCVITMLFPNNAVASLTISMVCQLPNEVNIQGTKGHIKIPEPFWSPTKLEVVTGTVTGVGVESKEKLEVLEFPLPESSLPQNYPNAVGMRYEAEAVRHCIMQGANECSLVSHADSLYMAELLESLRHDLGYTLPGDET